MSPLFVIVVATCGGERLAPGEAAPAIDGRSIAERELANEGNSPEGNDAEIQGVLRIGVLQN